jgi:hypothetical protein
MHVCNQSIYQPGRSSVAYIGKGCLSCPSNQVSLGAITYFSRNGSFVLIDDDLGPSKQEAAAAAAWVNEEKTSSVWQRAA